MWPLQEPNRLCQVSLLGCLLSVEHKARKILYISTQMPKRKTFKHYSALTSLCVPQTIDLKEKNSLH